MSLDALKALILGVVEGLTEFLPVSSTGHLLLLERFFGFDDDQFGKTFVVLIQLGAILAILSIYFLRLWKIALGFFTDPAARRFVIGVLIAFLRVWKPKRIMRVNEAPLSTSLLGMSFLKRLGGGYEVRNDTLTLWR